MWAAWVVTAIDLVAVVFMVRFLIALLREGAPSVCYWVVPARGEPEKYVPPKALRIIYFDDDCRPTECNRGDYYLEFLENENYAKEECASGLSALRVRPVGSVGWRSVHPGRGFLREHRL
jgi:hypothetical protein